MSVNVKPITVEKFLSFYKSESTKKSYSSGLKSFFGFVYKGEAELEEKIQRYFTEERDFKEDISNYLVAMKDAPPKTVSLYITSIKMLMVDCGIELPTKFWRRFNRRRGGRRARTQDKVPSNQELKMILAHMPIQGKALFLLLASSGMRIGETLQIQLDDMDLETNHIWVRGEITKSREPRHVFFSDETKEYLEEWLKNRNRYIEQAKGRTAKEHRKEENGRLFPFEPFNTRTIWNNACKKTGNGEKDKNTNRRLLHPHVLRKFFRSKMGVVVPIDIVEALMGHEGYLTEVYRRYSREDLAKFYTQGEHVLSIFADTGEIHKLKDELKQDRENLQRILNGQSVKILDLENRVQVLQDENTDLRTFRDTVMNDNYLDSLVDKGIEKALGMKIREFNKLYDNFKKREQEVDRLLTTIKKREPHLLE